MSFKLSTAILQALKEVREHTMGVMEAFDFINEQVSEEMDYEINRMKEEE